MNIVRFAGLNTIALFSLIACASQPPPAVAPTSAPTLIRAQPGDTVYLIEHYVRPEGREQFEQFVDQVLWPALQQTAGANAVRGRILRQTRLLRPLAPNTDDSYTYTFVLDPAVPGESYNVLDILREAYSEEEALQHYGRFTESWAHDFTSRIFVQTGEPFVR
ncbi:MAG: hypothetical protein H0U67_05185 [Gemmatimonadetes bacterium]|jgi:hypothetical protein|nr:hypothetical protein [Gemmatimonadota bacterium]